MKYWIFILSIFFLASCKAPCRKESDIKRNYVNQDLKDFFIFNKGSYWVYENQDKTKRDSIYVSDYSSTWTPKDRMLCSQDESIYYTWKSTGRHFFQADSINFGASFSITNTSKQYLDLIFDGINFLSIHENTPYLNVGEYQRSKHFVKNSNLLLNNSQYNGEYYQYKDSGLTNLYIGRYVGILGWVNQSDTFNLTRYMIEK